MPLPNPLQAVVVSRTSPIANQESIQLALFDSTGAALTVGKQVAFQADVGAVTSVVAAGATPTKAEYDALRADALATRTTLNALLAKMRTSGLMPSS